MSPTAFFEVRWQDDGGEEQRFTIDLGNEEERIGERITELTRAARNTPDSKNRRMRLDVLARPPLGINTSPLADYLWANEDFNAARFQRHLEALMNGEAVHTYSIKTVVVHGADLVGRDDLVQKVLDRLASGSCHLRAPRRYGKTSLMGRLEREVEAALRVDLSHAATSMDFALAVLREARRSERAAKALESVFDDVVWEGRDEAFEESLRELTDQHKGRGLWLFKCVLGTLADVSVTLLIDEFGLFLRALTASKDEDALPVLSAAAELRKRSKSPLRWVVAGSTGLSTYIKYSGFEEQLGDLVAIDVGPLSDEDTRFLIEELLYGQRRRPEKAVAGRALEHLGRGVPYFVHYLINEVIHEVGSRQTITPDDVDEAYFERLLGSTGSECFKPFRLGDRPYPEAHRRAAEKILDRLANSQKPVAEEDVKQLFEQVTTESKPDGHEVLMTCLEEDYDLGRSSAGWTMRNKVLADRWRRTQRR